MTIALGACYEAACSVTDAVLDMRHPRRPHRANLLKLAVAELGPLEEALPTS